MSIRLICALVLALSFSFLGCSDSGQQTAQSQIPIEAKNDETPRIQNQRKVIHVLVALCDNENQGIVPVSATLGNGQDPVKNLYWGAAFGVKTFFSKSANWIKVSAAENPRPGVLERVIFKHKSDGTLLVADAYDGSKMKETIDDFFSAASGNKRENIDISGETVQVFSSANLIAFIGHDGLMDFHYEKRITKKDDDPRDAVILACASKQYFSAPLKRTGAKPLLWTTNLMAPEAYILHEALEGWIRSETGEQVRVRAANAYAKYQKISQGAALGLFATGW